MRRSIVTCADRQAQGWLPDPHGLGRFRGPASLPRPSPTSAVLTRQDPELFGKLRGRLGAASHDAPFVLDPTDRHRILDLSQIKLYPISKPIARTVLRGTLFERPLDAGIVGPSITPRQPLTVQSSANSTIATRS